MEQPEPLLVYLFELIPEAQLPLQSSQFHLQQGQSVEITMSNSSSAFSLLSEVSWLRERAGKESGERGHMSRPVCAT